MKGLGLAGAGIGAAAMSAPVFHDLDEVTSAPNGKLKRPWYVKEREINNPTCEIDFKIMSRMNDNNCLHGDIYAIYSDVSQYRMAKIFGTNVVANMMNKGSERVNEGIQNNIPGWNLRDAALNHASCYMAPISFVNTGNNFAGSLNTPSTYGVTKWTGTPEENSQMLRSAAKFLGASEVQFGELDSNTKKLVFNNFIIGAKPIVFENVDVGYETDSKFVFPDRQLYVISVAIQMSKELFRHGQSQLRWAANMSRYRQWCVLQNELQGFLTGLGYQAFGYPVTYYGLMPALADAVLTGHAEISRNDNVCISPEFGTVTGYYSLITDLPLAPSKPIDAGIFRFCHTCRKCADACPKQAIRHDKEPSWDLSPSALDPKKENVWSTPGKKTFHTDAGLCMSMWWETSVGCAICMGTCTFNTNSASVHQLVRSTLSTTPVFNRFLWQADKTFGYGITADEDKEKWWDYSLPTLGYDTTVTSFDGGYSK